MEIGVGLVELHRGELRVVLGVHTLVAENAADLIHPLHAAHDEPLEGQLGGDAHIHVDVQGVVMGDKGAGGGAAGDGVEHRGLHLDVAHVVQIAPHELDEPGADLKVALHVPLTESGLLVGEAVELLRQGDEGLGQKGDLVGLDGYLAPLGLKDLAVNAHDVADVGLFELGKGLLPQLVDADIELDAALSVLKIAEHSLAHAALGHDPARHGDLFALQLFKLLLYIGAVRGDDVFGDLEGVLSRVLELLELGAANEPLLRQVQLLGGACVLLFCHVGSSCPRLSQAF